MDTKRGARQPYIIEITGVIPPVPIQAMAPALMVVATSFTRSLFTIFDTTFYLLPCLHFVRSPHAKSNNKIHVATHMQSIDYIQLHIYIRGIATEIEDITR